MVATRKMKSRLHRCLEQLLSRTVAAKTNTMAFIRIFSYTSAKDRIILLTSIAASICAGATLPMMNIILARLVKSFSTFAVVSPEDFSTVFMAVINRYVLFIVYLFFGRLLLVYIAIIGFRMTSLKVSAAIRLSYLRALLQLPISTLDGLPPGQTTAIVTITANILQLGISERLSSLIQAVAVILTALLVGCVFSWELTLVTFTGLVAIIVWYAIITPIVARRYADVQTIEREAASLAAEALSSMKMIAACSAEAKISKKYDNLVDRTKAMSKKLSPVLALQHSPVFFMIFATFALCFWFATKLYLRLVFKDVETLVVVLMSLMTMLAHISSISVPLTAATNATKAAQIFFSIIDAPKPSIFGAQEEGISFKDEIILENVYFAYPTRHNIKVLNNLTLRIPAGMTTAIVGPSGSGKSTILALIQRWYELGESNPIAYHLRRGTIKIGDRNLNEIDLRWWRSQIGFVQQDPFLFSDTILANIAYGLVGTEWEYASQDLKHELVIEACKEAYADEFIRKLPEGYFTQVGDLGLHFSGGQRQRIAIARAIIRQPKILIFDEATSALDASSERIVLATLKRVAKNRTTIVLAHQLSTIMNADRIVVVSDGQIIQQGTHSSLLRDVNGTYSRLVGAQKLTTNTSTLGRDAILQPRLDKTLDARGGRRSTRTIMSSKLIEMNAGNEVTHRSPSSITIFGTLWCLLTEQKQNWLGTLVMILSTIVAAASNPLQAYLFGRLISSFAYLTEQLSASTSLLCTMLVAVAVGLGASYFALGWLSNDISAASIKFKVAVGPNTDSWQKTVAKYRKEYFRNIISKRISFFDDANNSAGLLSARLATDPVQLQQLVGINMAMVSISILSLIGCIAVAEAFHWKFATIVIFSSLPIILIGGWYRVRHELKFEARSNEVFADSAQFVTEAIGAIRTVASLTLERVVCDKYDGMLKYHIQQSWKEARLSCLVFAASDSLVLLCMAFALWYGGYLMAHGELIAYHFLVVYLAIIQGTLAAGQWLSFGPNFAQVSVAMNRIRCMRRNLAEDVNMQFSKHHIYSWKLPTSLPWKGADVEFRNVHFAYPTRKTPVLNGISLTIQHGQFAAIVGSSGSGKTTIISLLQRFYEPTLGSIWQDGNRITSMPLDVLRKRMSLVAQEAYLFRGTIRENILLGMDEENVSEETIHLSCRHAGIHDFIKSLPDGYDTDIGTSGVSLSGGQRQRISIARALIRNPAILLLDEATSSLDSHTEREVQEVFEQTGEGRTIICVAHRLATVKKADVIFVMHEGRIVEKGDHQSLLRLGGTYWQMCQAQSLLTA